MAKKSNPGDYRKVMHHLGATEAEMERLCIVALEHIQGGISYSETARRMGLQEPNQATMMAAHAARKIQERNTTLTHKPGVCK